MTFIKRKSDGTIEEITDVQTVNVAADEDVFSEATQAAAADAIDDWELNTTYKSGDIVAHDGKLWRCIQQNGAVSLDWSPGTAWSLWAETWESGAIPDWKQPQGAHDAYPAGFKVLHNGDVWVSDIDANVWEPGVIATWTELNNTG